jgi:hypothetical protein
MDLSHNAVVCGKSIGGKCDQRPVENPMLRRTACMELPGTPKNDCFAAFQQELV